MLTGIMQRIIRDGLATIQGRRAMDLPQQSADTADIERWGKYKKNGPTTEDGLPLCLSNHTTLSAERKKYASSWNYAAFESFFAWLITVHPEYRDREAEAQARFMSHVRSLKRKFQEYLKGPADSAQTKAQNNARQRRINVLPISCSLLSSIC